MTKQNEAFYQGFACAIATLARYGSTSPTDIMQSNGISLKDLEQGGVEEFDLAPIRADWRLTHA
jgi:hypothetical protein